MIELRQAPFLRSLASIPILLLAVGAAGSCGREPPPLLDHQALLEGHDWWDNQDWDWYEENIPFFESPDSELDATYYYRWEVLTKHLVYGSPATGYTFTEFIDRPFWSGSYGAISCPLGHQAYEIRWLKDRRVIEDFARYWFETPGAQPRSYSNWYGDAMWGSYAVLGDTTFLRTVYPHMETQVAGWTEERWDAEQGMYRWVGAWDGMETNINSRLTEDEFSGGEGYRPTLNAYLYADMMAISRAAYLFGEDGKAAEYEARAAALKARVQEELWDPTREFFFHQFASDEKDGIQAKSLTYQTGHYAGDPHGRELIGYVPWQFNLPDPGYEAAWKYLMDPAFFWADYGPTGVEQGDPQFFVSPRCCVWSGNAWPYATAQTLTAMANLLNDYDQEVVDRDDYFALLKSYALSHRRDGRPYIAEASDPFTGSWDGHNTFYHSEHYLHSGFLDQLITGLVGLRPRADDTLQVNPLVPQDWEYFALEGVDYHGHDLTIVWDRDGSRYGRGGGLVLLLDGEEVARRAEMGQIRVAIPSPVVPEGKPRLNNYAVNNEGGYFPYASASSSHPVFPPFYAVDGNRWYHPSPPNRWVAGEAAVPEGARLENRGQAPEGLRDPHWFQVDFGVERPLTEIRLYFLDDASGPAVEAVGEEGLSGFPLEAAGRGAPILPPESYEVEYWNGAGWVAVPEQDRALDHPMGRRANTLRFPEIRTSRVRAVLRPQESATVGLTEVEAWGPRAMAEPGYIDEPGSNAEPESAAEPAGPIPNLALNASREGYPRVSASYTYGADSPWEAVDGRLALTRYSRNRWTAFDSPNLEDWLEVDFGGLRTVGRVEIFLYGDGRGVAAPEEYRVEVWAEGSWHPVTPIRRNPEEPLAWALNRIDFQPEETQRVRVVLRHASPSASGIAEVRIFP